MTSMLTARTRYVLLLLAVLLLIMVSNAVLGTPGLDRVWAGEHRAGWLLLGACLLVDVLLIVVASVIARRPAFKYRPIDITLPREERKALARDEEDDRRRLKG